MPQYSHRVIRECEYYTTGPQQGREADGILHVGDRVELTAEHIGSYVRVVIENGVKCYVAENCLERI